MIDYNCTNCIYDGTSTASAAMAANAELLAFLTEHGLDPLSPSHLSQVGRVTTDYDEVVRSTDPFEATFRFAVDGDALVLTVDGDLSVVDATRRRASTPA